MNPEVYVRVRELFLRALETPAPERAAMVDTACVGDAELRSEVMSLLAQHDATGPFLDLSIVTPGVAMAKAAGPHPENIGGYRILDVLGEGGMGIVYRAEQDNPCRIVALKVVRPGFTTARSLRRFEHEAQVLGRLQHPGIAQIFAAGQADTGAGPQPFFAMELVTGLPLTTWAQQQRLDVRARMALLAEIGDAVHHAHQKGVVHCDLKPANILVDASGHCKVLDFGVARVTDAEAHGNSLRTSEGQLIGTLAYMSPEQALADPAQLDTRVDVYSLGVVGYELLSGELPHELIGKRLLEAVRILRDEAPAPLGTRVPALRGDVATIIDRAMQKDREHRYQSAFGFAADIRRWLQHEPIVARPASALYHLRKFAERHRALVIGVAATFVALLAGVVGTGLALVQAYAAEAQAATNLTRARKAEREATAKGQLADKTSEFLDRTIFSIDPNLVGTEVKFADMLRKAAGEVETTFADEPLVRARVQTTLGETFRGLGLLPEAERQLTAAYELRRAELGDTANVTRSVRTHLAMTLKALHRLDDAAAHYREIVGQQEQEFGTEHEYTLDARHNLAEILEESGQLAEAEALYRDVLAVRVRTIGEDHLSTLATQNNLASLLYTQGRREDCEAMLRKIIEIRTRVQGQDHPERLVSLNNLAYILQGQRRLDEAEPLFREAVERQLVVLGPEHHETLSARSNLGSLLRQRGNPAEAEVELRAVYAARQHALGESHLDTLRAAVELAGALVDGGRREEAGALVDAVQAQWPAVAREDSTDVIKMLDSFVSALQALGRLADAEVRLRDLVERERTVLGEDNGATLKSLNNLALAQHGLGRVDEAKVNLGAALAGFRRTLGLEHAATLGALYSLAFLHFKNGEPALAVPLLRESLAVLERKIGPHESRALTTLATLARCLQQTNETEEAERAFTLLEDRLVDTDWPLAQPSLHALNRIGRLLTDAGRHTTALPVLDKLAELAERAPALAGREAPVFLRNRADSLMLNGRFDEAEQVLQALLEASDAAAKKK